ncbi:MAG TPA: hypothetical protein VF397_12330 [Pyrinomonadaceae bacterium]
MKRSLLLVLIALTICSRIQSQNIPPETTAALDRINQAFDLNLKGWTREQYTPFQPSSGLAERWKTLERSVNIFIAKLPTSTRELPKNAPSMEPLEGVYDEAMVFGYDGDVTCRHGEFAISISSSVHFTLFSKDAIARGLDQSEAKATSRLIACFVNLALDGKLSPNWPHTRQPIFQRPCERELMFKGLIGEEIMTRYTPVLKKLIRINSSQTDNVRRHAYC